MLKIDMWYGDSHEDADAIDVTFYDCDVEYRGNIYKNGKVIGDYACNDYVELRKAFKQLHFTTWR